MILTDPYLGNSFYENNLLLKPFQNFNKINIIHLPITTAIGCCDSLHLSLLFSNLKPKRILID